MQTFKLVRQRRMPRRTANEMILLFAKWGNHNKREIFASDADVKRAFERQGVDFSELVEKCRDHNEAVPFFENLLGSTWETMGSGSGSITLQSSTGEEIEKIVSPGKFTSDPYWAKYELASAALERAVSAASYPEFLSSVVHGIASIEAFISERVFEWNKKYQDQQLVDSMEKKVGFDEKISAWLPVLSEGRKLDKGGGSVADVQTT